MLLQHLVVLAFVQTALSQVLKEERIVVQLEDVVNVNDTSQWRWRSNAGNDKTARFYYPGGFITLTLCVEPDDPAFGVTVRFKGIRYSNDGRADTVYAFMDRQPVGSKRFLKAHSWRGKLWNIFYDSGWYDNSFTLTPGKHEFKIDAVTDITLYIRINFHTDIFTEGLELDAAVFDVVNLRNATEFICGTHFHQIVRTPPN